MTPRLTHEQRKARIAEKIQLFHSGREAGAAAAADEDDE
jgi:hypothetical protein